MNRRWVVGVLGAVLAWATVGSGLAGSVAVARGASSDGWRHPRQLVEFKNFGHGVELGSSVSISRDGSTVLVGATGYAPTGAAFVLVNRDGSWHKVATLLPSDPMSGEEFGSSVALSADGSTAIVGAPFPSSTIGAAYVYKRDGGSWNQVSELTPSSDAEFFGSGVALSAHGSTALIGAYETHSANGAAFVFDESGDSYLQSATITPPGDAFYFGNAVSLSRNGRTALIGANGGSFFTNGAYVYTLTAGAWTQAAAFANPGGSNSDDFGGAVAISSNAEVAVIGASGDNSSTGAAYVYRNFNGTWSQTTKLVGTNGRPSDLFGISVGIGARGSRVLVGAMGQDGYSGAAYLFNHGRTGLRHAATIYASDRSDYSMFGSSAALSAQGTTAVIGADAYPSAGYDGAAYVEQTGG